MKLEGIPNNINANHNHNVVLEVQVSKETADRVKDVAVTVLTVAATMAIAKSLVGTANRMLLDQQYHKLWSGR